MVAYSYKRRFEQPIVDRIKTGTIRAERKRHARPGETFVPANEIVRDDAGRRLVA